MRYTKHEQERAQAMLADLRPSETVFFICRKTTGSGWRHYDFYVMRDNEPSRLTWAIAVTLGYPLSDASLRVNGYATTLVTSLSWHLFRDEYKLKYMEL